VTLTRLASLAREHEIEVFNVHYRLSTRSTGSHCGNPACSRAGGPLLPRQRHPHCHGLAGWVRAAYRYLLRHADVIACCSKTCW